MASRFCGFLLATFIVSSSSAREPIPVSYELPSAIDGVIVYSDQVCEPPIMTKAQRMRYQVTLIQTVADTFQVPAGALFGIWMKESHGLQRDWGPAAYWLRASKLTWRNSDCVVRYGVDRCWDQWLSLKRICAQRLKVGAVSRTLCDPLRVRTSYAMALGPMQHMPMTLLPEKGRREYRWAPHVVDFDGDGVFDPFELPDAMAATALFIKRHHSRKYRELGHKKAWVYAINRYYGSQTAGYYEGNRRRKGVVHHWRKWCRMTGDCRARAVYSTVAMVKPPRP